MSKKRTDLNEFALPIPGMRTRRAGERIKIEGARTAVSSTRSEALPAPGVDFAQSSRESSSNHVAANGARIATDTRVLNKSKEELAKLEDSELLTLFQA